MLAGKTLTDFINLLSPNNFKNNDDIILNCLKNGLAFQISVGIVKKL